MAMDEYHVTWRSFPTDDPNANPDEFPDPYELGVELDRTILDEFGGIGEHFNKSDLDSDDDRYFKDFFRDSNRIRYRKSGRHKLLIWSLGPDGEDQIGLENKPRGGDDISNEMLDYMPKKRREGS